MDFLDEVNIHQSFSWEVSKFFNIFTLSIFAYVSFAYEEVLEDKANDEVCIRFGVVLKLCRKRCGHYDHRGIEWGWYR